MHPILSTTGMDLPCLSKALAKAILNHPAIAEKIKEDPELSALYSLFLETDLQQHYQAQGITGNQQTG